MDKLFSAQTHPFVILSEKQESKLEMYLQKGMQFIYLET